VLAVESTPPGGESMLDLRERVLAGWGRLRERAAGETVLVVTHGGPIYVLLGHVRDADLVSAVLDGAQDNCGLTELRVGDGIEVVRENETV
jgi:probable phosphoglycerate mutase